VNNPENSSISIRIKRLVIGAGPVSQEFHEPLHQSIVGVEGVIQIEDDLGQTQEQHNKHLNVILNTLKEMGVMLWKEKCVWSVPEVIWFSYKFSKVGMSADPSKVEGESLVILQGITAH